MAYEGTIAQLKRDIENYQEQMRIKREHKASLPASMKGSKESDARDIESLKKNIAYKRQELARFREAEKQAKATERANKKMAAAYKASLKKSSSKKSGGFFSKLFG